MVPALIELAADSTERRIIIATHGAVIRTVLLFVNAPIERGVPITNGSVHSFRHVSGGLELVEFDDPIELDSVVAGDEDFDEQNALEEREETETR